MLVSHHPINMDQQSSQLPHPANPKECGSGYHVAPSVENTTRNGFGWRLRPVSELRRSTRMYRELFVKCRR